MRLSSQKKGICTSCHQPVAPGTEIIINRRLFCNMCQPHCGAAATRRAAEAIASGDAVARDDVVVLQKVASFAAAAVQKAVEGVARGVARDDIDYLVKDAAAAVEAAQQAVASVWLRLPLQQAAVACDVDNLVEAAAAAVEVNMEDLQAATSAAQRQADWVPCDNWAPVQAAKDVARVNVADHMEDAKAKHSSTGERKRRRVLLAEPLAFGLQPGPSRATTSSHGLPLLLIPPALLPADSPSVFATQPAATAPPTMPPRALPWTPLHAGSSSSSVPCLT